MKRFVSRFAICALLCGLAAQGARADGVADEAEVNFRLGAERYQAGDFRGALAFFLASNRLAPNHKVRFNIARAFQRLGQFPEAYRWCQSALEGATDPQLRAQLEETRSAIEREVALIEVTTEPAGATVYVDRKDLGSLASAPARIALPAGEHKVIVELEGYKPQESPTLTLRNGNLVSVPFALERIVGTLDIQAEAATEVRADHQDGAPDCVTPCSVQLSPGLHSLHFRRAGYRTPSVQAQVTANVQQAVKVEAIPLTGSIVVTAAEADSLVEVDGVSVGFTPVVVRNVAVGKRVVRVSQPGFEPVVKTVEVQEHSQAELRDLVLVPTREVRAATRLNQSIEEAPASVSVVSAQEMAAFRYPTIAEALRGQRGVTLTNDGAYASVSVRGLGQPGDYGNRVLVLSDGATLNDNILWQSYVGYDGRVDLGDVQRIELVRGPGSVLYGTGAVSGVVNLIPRDMPKRTTGEVQVGTQDARTARGRAAAAMPLGEHGGISLSASGAHGDGQSITLPMGQQSVSVSDFKRFDAATGNGRLVYRALTVQGFLTTREQQIPQGAYGALPGMRPNRLRDTRGLAEVRFEPEITRNVRLFTRAYANLYQFDSKQAYPGEQQASNKAVAEEQYAGRWFGAEARAVVQATPGLRVSVGGELSASTQASLSGNWTEAGSTKRYLNEHSPYQIYSAYGLAEWRTTSWLTVTAGGRVDSWSTFGATFNPRMVLLARPTTRDVIKLMGGRAFRAPSIYELHYNDGGATQVESSFGGNKLKPELVWSGELEYTHAFQDGWSVLGAGHFQYALDLIQQVPLEATDSQSPVRYQNGGSSVYTAGGDLELRRELRAGWMLAANGTYLLARYVHPADALNDSRVPNVPRYGASARGVVPLAAGFRLALRTTLEAPRRISPYTRATTSTAVISDLVLTGEVPRYGVDYAIGLYNLFDWRVALPTDPTFLTTTMPQAGRTLLASVAIRL